MSSHSLFISRSHSKLRIHPPLTTLANSLHESSLKKALEDKGNISGHSNLLTYTKKVVHLLKPSTKWQENVRSCSGNSGMLEVVKPNQKKTGPKSLWHLTANQTSAKRTEQNNNQKNQSNRSLLIGTGVGIQQSRGYCYLNSLLSGVYINKLFFFFFN